MQKENSVVKGKIFENHVAFLFSLLGYNVIKQDELIAGRQIDLIVEDQSGPLSRQYIVECKDRTKAIRVEHFDSFDAKLRAVKNAANPKMRGIMVSRVGFTKAVKAHALHSDVELIQISDLEKSIIDFSGYVHGLISRLENDPSLKYFIEPLLQRENLSVSEFAFDFLNEWLLSPSLNQLTLLGDYGTGKSTLLKMFALKMAHYYQTEAVEKGGRARVPIFIDLRDYTHVISLKQIILDLLDTYSIKAASYSAFEYVILDGQVLLILDGFDEMVSRGNYEVTLRNFRELNKNALGKTKIILSCRTHYFTNLQDIQRFHGTPANLGNLSQSYTDLYREIATKSNFLISYLMEFKSDQIEEYLQKRCGSNSEKVKFFINNTYNLKELSSRPVLLDLIVASEGKIDAGNLKITPGLLYQVYTDIWLSNNDWSSIIDVNDKLELLEYFAFMASTNKEFSMHYKDIPEIIKTWRSELKEIDTIEIDRELRTASFLINDKSGNYKFSNRSFQEFFYAKYLISSLMKGSYETWMDGFFQTEIYRFLSDILLARKDVVSHIKKLLKKNDLNDYLMANIIKSIFSVADGEIAQILVFILQHGKNQLVQRSAATTLGYSSDKDVVSVLISKADAEENRYVRTNSLIALARLNTEKGNQFLLEIFTGSRPFNWNGIICESFINSMAKVRNEEIIKAYFNWASGESSNQTLTANLRMCQNRWTPEGEAYCHRIFSQSRRPKSILMAFRTMRKAKHRYLTVIFQTINDYFKAPISAELILALKGLKDKRVKTFLLEKLQSKSERNNMAALEVLLEDYQEILIEKATFWMRRGNFKETGFNWLFRTFVAKEYMRHHSPKGLENLLHFLSQKEKAGTRTKILSLIKEYYPDRFAGVVKTQWEKENAPLVKKALIKFLWEFDCDASKSLILEKAVRDMSPGVRVFAHSMLSADKSKCATDALMRALQTDDSKWVRIQALRSLYAPGRNIDKSKILYFSKQEKDSDVIRFRKELIGT